MTMLLCDKCCESTDQLFGVQLQDEHNIDLCRGCFELVRDAVYKTLYDPNTYALLKAKREADLAAAATAAKEKEATGAQFLDG